MFIYRLIFMIILFGRSLVGKSLRGAVKNLGYNDLDSFLAVLSSEGAVLVQHTSNGPIYRAGVCSMQLLIWTFNQ